ncbi:hypothetical protein BC829DRAFT_448503 [Chytridium lagenaria]|nr:hypothetical protein BC829DRAFT_448503 [Chytridium lagenaria]
MANSTVSLNEALSRITGVFSPALTVINPYIAVLFDKYPHETYLILTLLAIGAPLFIALAIRPLLDRGVKMGKVTPEAHRDMIVLHIYEKPRKLSGLANLSPVCLKLEMILRVSQTPYIRVTNTGMSSKGLKPYITYNGEEVADPDFCVRWLEEKMGISLDTGLEASERGAVEAYRTMIEEGLNWQILYWIWAIPSSWPWVPFTPKALPSLQRRILEIMETRLEALSTLLASDDYLMGTPEPTSLDCVAYAFLAKILLQDLPDSLPARLVLRKPNLVRFVRRMSEAYFSEVAGEVDWDAIEEAAEDEADEDYIEEED